MKPVQTSVRLEPGQKEKLDAIAARNGVDPSQLIRWAVEALIQHAEKHGGRLLLPIDFSETFTVTPIQVVPNAKEHRVKKSA